MWEDPIVKEVREIRRQNMAECGNDRREYARRLRESQKRHGDRLVRREPQRVPAPDEK
ncbi:MAG: hypothetical protein ACOC8E_04040 [Planctomycetota bacterium]